VFLQPRLWLLSTGTRCQEVMNTDTSIYLEPSAIFYRDAENRFLWKNTMNPPNYMVSHSRWDHVLHHVHFTYLKHRMKLALLNRLVSAFWPLYIFCLPDNPFNYSITSWLSMLFRLKSPGKDNTSLKQNTVHQLLANKTTLRNELVSTCNLCSKKLRRHYIKLVCPP
jgi:hypothetical protein